MTLIRNERSSDRWPSPLSPERPVDTALAHHAADIFPDVPLERWPPRHERELFRLLDECIAAARSVDPPRQFPLDGFAGFRLGKALARFPGDQSREAEKLASLERKAGSALAYGPGSRLEPVAAPAAVIQPDWTEGWAEYRSIKLGALVAEANRYAAVPIVIDDTDIAAREVSGRFHISQTEAFAERIAILFGLAIERRSDAIHLRRR